MKQIGPQMLNSTTRMSRLRKARNKTQLDSVLAKIRNKQPWIIEMKPIKEKEWHWYIAGVQPSFLNELLFWLSSSYLKDWHFNLKKGMTRLKAVIENRELVLGIQPGILLIGALGDTPEDFPRWEGASFRLRNTRTNITIPAELIK